MRMRMAVMILIALLTSVLVFLLMRSAMQWGVRRWYLTESAETARCDRYADELRAFLREHPAKAGDRETVGEFARAMHGASVVVVIPEGSYEAFAWGLVPLDESEVQRDKLVKLGYRFYSMPFADGETEVAVRDVSEAQVFNTIEFVSLIIACGVLALVLLMHSKWITDRIRLLSDAVNTVSHGDLDHEIVPLRRDEISRLAADVETMRTAILQRARSEQSALQANSDLITALSHDIRNPLTALIGYLELIDMDRDALPETDREYLRTSLEKSYRIRDLTNELFRYFLVFGREAEAADFERYDAQMLLWQMLGEVAEDLISNGFLVKSIPLQTECMICTDVGLLKRVVDNLVSNVQKYADPDREVCISADALDGRVVVRIRNSIAPAQPGAVESNRIGLRTCEAIMKLLHGEFRTAAEDGEFLAEFCLPMEE